MMQHLMENEVNALKISLQIHLYFSTLFTEISLFKGKKIK